MSRIHQNKKYKREGYANNKRTALGRLQSHWNHFYNPNGGLTIPGYRYCGPGNRMKGKPINKLDEACKRHDETPNYSYTQWEDSDDRLIQDSFDNFWEDPVAAPLVNQAFQVKKLFAPMKRKGNHLTLRRKNRFKRRKATRRRPFRGFAKRRRLSKPFRATKRFRRVSRFRGRRSFRRTTSSVKRMLQILNPPQYFREGFLTEYKPGVNSHLYMMPFCFYFQSAGLKANNIYNPFQRQGIITALNSTYFASGTADTNMPSGDQWWILNRFIETKIKVNCVAKVFAVVYYCRAKRLCIQGPINAATLNLSNQRTYQQGPVGALNWTSQTDPITTGAAWQQVVADTGSGSTGPMIAKINPLLTLSEATVFKKQWHVYKTKKLEWDNQKLHTITLSSRRPFLYDPMSYTIDPTITSATGVISANLFTYKPGDKEVFIRFYTDPLPSAATAQKAGYPNFDIAMETRLAVRMCKRVVSDKQLNVTFSQGNVAADPQIVEITESVVAAS